MRENFITSKRNNNSTDGFEADSRMVTRFSYLGHRFSFPFFPTEQNVIVFLWTAMCSIKGLDTIAGKKQGHLVKVLSRPL